VKVIKRNYNKDFMLGFSFFYIFMCRSNPNCNPNSNRDWINSLNYDDLHVVNLVEDMGDGIVLLKLLSHLRTGIVDWGKVDLNPKSLYQNIENVNYAISLAKIMGVVLVNVGWIDIVNGDKKMIFSILSQLMKRHPSITGNKSL
jgi:hypothetical protein